VITDVVPILVVPGHVPTKTRTRTHAAKKTKSKNVSKSETPYVSVSIPSSETRSGNPISIFKQPHTMTSPYVDPIVKLLHVEPNVFAIVETSKKYVSDVVSHENPRSEKALGKSSFVNDYVDGVVDNNVHDSPHKENRPDLLTFHVDETIVELTNETSDIPSEYDVRPNVGPSQVQQVVGVDKTMPKILDVSVDEPATRPSLVQTEYIVVATTTEKDVSASEHVSMNS